MAARFVLAYDADCGACSLFKDVVDMLDPAGRIQFASLEEADDSGLLARIAPPSRYSSFHLIRHAFNGVDVREVWSGSEALLPLIRLLSPCGTTASRILEAVPGGATAAAFAYSTLSRLHRTCPARPSHDSSMSSLVWDEAPRVSE